MTAAVFDSNIRGLLSLNLLLSAALSLCNTPAALAVRWVQIDAPALKSLVPEITVQGRFLAPQAISAVDVSAQENLITVGTMAFSHDANVWQFGSDGALLAARYLPPWAPMQVVTLAGGRAMAVGLAYSRVTTPEPTVWFGRADELLSETLRDGLAEADSPEGQFARLRPGAGAWRAGWLASYLGELFVRGPDWVFKPPGWWLHADGRREPLAASNDKGLPTSRALRMAASADGRRAAFGWLGFNQNVPGLPSHPEALSLCQINPPQRLWSAPSKAGAPPALPNPVADFTELAKDFRLSPDVLPSGHAATALALNRDGSRIALVEQGVWGWLREGPAIGTWDPPIHALNFLPRQRGQLRVFNGEGRELLSEGLPEEGMFEVGFAEDDEIVWCWPTAWFARGMAGAVWLPVDSPARTLWAVEWKTHTATALVFPDAIADCALSAGNQRVLVSCWNGRIYLLDQRGRLVAKLEVGAPARLAWSPNGGFAAVGTADGRLLRLEPNGKIGWSKVLPARELPPLTQPPAPVVDGLPIFQGGRIPNGEHAYVGDIWLIQAGKQAVIVDAGGLSGFSVTQARLRALGIERVTHVLHTHSHGDHCGGAYLWRAAGAQIVGPKIAALDLTWLMPMLTDYGIYPPRPLDIPLPLTRVGDEAGFALSGLTFHALFVPGHSLDMTVYMMDLAGRRIAFTGDLGFEGQDILHRCWGDAAKARAILPVVRDKLLGWRPEVVFTGHGVRTNGTEFIASLVRHTEQSLKQLDIPKERESH